MEIQVLLKPNNQIKQLNMKFDLSGLIESISDIFQSFMKADFYVMVAGAVMLCLVVLLVAVLKHP